MSIGVAIAQHRPHGLTGTASGAGTRSGIRRSRRVAADVVGIGDVAAVILGAFLPAVTYELVNETAYDWTLILQSSLAAAIITYLCLRSWDMYDTTRMDDFPRAPGRLLLALLIGLAGVYGLGVPAAIQGVHRVVWLVLWLLASNALILLWRQLAHIHLNALTGRGCYHEAVAVFGAGEIARRVQAHLSDPRYSIELAGVYDDRMGDDRLDDSGLKVSGRLDDLIAAARNEEIDQVVIALPQSADRRIADVVRKLQQVPASLHVVTHISSDLVDPDGSNRVSSFGPVGLLDVKRKPLTDWAPIVKEAEDLIVGTLVLLAFLPVFPLIALAIKLDSPGPILFRQCRRGLNQRVFEVLKFRTMSVLEDGDAVRQVKPGDQRVTRVGRFLRRTSLDELPQILNVLKGEMSLVGPRPHALVHDEQFSEMLETYANRHQVKPGITGLAQVMGFRGETSSADKIEGRVNADIDYIRNWSLALDLKILAKTVKAVLAGINAH